VFRDTVVFGSALVPTETRDSVRQLPDTNALGFSWRVLLNGARVLPGADIIREGIDRLWVFQHPTVVTPASSLPLLPLRLGESAPFWQLVSIADTVHTPAGTFAALHFTSVQTFVPDHIWAVPGIGVVRVLRGTQNEFNSAFQVVRTRRFVVELDSLIVP
jgi:hypothetical protein